MQISDPQLRTTPRLLPALAESAPCFLKVGGVLTDEIVVDQIALDHVLSAPLKNATSPPVLIRKGFVGQFRAEESASTTDGIQSALHSRFAIVLTRTILVPAFFA